MKKQKKKTMPKLGRKKEQAKKIEEQKMEKQAAKGTL